MNEEDQRIFNNALKIATSLMSSDGELIYYDIEGALQDTGLFAKQYVIRGGVNFFDASTASVAEKKCNELIEQGYHIDSVAIGRHSYLIVYSDKGEL